MLTLMEVYIIIFTFAGLGVAFSSQLGVLRGGKQGSKREYVGGLQLPQNKRNAFSWVAFFSLTLVGLLIPIVASILGIVPNNPLPEIIFCVFYVLGPFRILPNLIVSRETGRLTVSFTHSYHFSLDLFLVGVWIWPWKLWRTKFAGGMFIVITFPLIAAGVSGVSPVLIISILPSLFVFSRVFDITRVHNQQAKKRENKGAFNEQTFQSKITICSLPTVKASSRLLLAFSHSAPCAAL